MQTNVTSVALHRTEAAVAAALPVGLPTPPFLGVVDTGDWIALCFADVVGRHPHTPWQLHEIDSVLDALEQLTAVPVDVLSLSLSMSLPTAEDSMADDLVGWERIVDDPPPTLPALAADHLSELRTLAAAGLPGVRGTALCHLDVRADNLLVDESEQVMVVDWPWAALGATWLDSACLLINMGLFGGHDLQRLLIRSPLLAAAPPADITAFLAGLAGMFVDAARRPANPGMPTLRTFQRDQGDAVLNWLAQRSGWTVA